MRPIQGDQNSGIDYTEANFTTGLEVAANIYERGVGETLVDTVPLVDAGNGCYVADYIFETGKRYRVHKAVYTDNTYTTLDTNYAPSVDMVEAIDFAAGGGGSVIGAQASALIDVVEVVASIQLLQFVATMEIIEEA